MILRLLQSPVIRLSLALAMMTSGLLLVADFSEVGELITDKAPPAAIATRIEAGGAKLTIAG